jgi:twitching motility protein PilT
MRASPHVSLLSRAKELRASDLHLVPGYPPLARVDGNLIAIAENPITADAATATVSALLHDRDETALEARRSADLGLDIGDGWRARCNVYFSGGKQAAAFRLIPERIMALKEIGAPAVVETIANLPNGLVLVTGPTGSGKSSTLAAMINHINATASKHIATIEDPVEFLHTGKKSLVTQREVGSDTPSFADGLRDCLREDPNVILVGELRDHETMALALRAAETGHLVLATLHTGSTAQAIDRFIDAFPSGDKDGARAILANVLRAVIGQVLLRRAGGKGRVAAFEVLIVTAAVHALIRESRADQIPSALQTGAKAGMQTLHADIQRLITNNIISKETARLALVH